VSRQTAGLRPFKKGQSGNPGGRKPIPPEIKEMARALTEDALKALGSIVKDKKAPHTARVSAAVALLDRGYGKPTQHIEAHVDLIDRLSLTEQEALASALATLAGEPGDAAEGTEQTHH
jgi:hypothetical protein